MISSAQSVAESGPLRPETVNESGSQAQFDSPIGSPEAELWGEVLLRAIEDFKTYMGYRKDPQENPLSAKMVRSIVADGCDPEYWIFAKSTGFSAVCMVLNVEPDCIRRFLRNWLKETHGTEPSY